MHLMTVKRSTQGHPMEDLAGRVSFLIFDVHWRNPRPNFRKSSLRQSRVRLRSVDEDGSTVRSAAVSADEQRSHGCFPFVSLRPLDDGDLAAVHRTPPLKFCRYSWMQIIRRIDFAP